MIHTYRNILDVVELSAPTTFSEVIKFAAGQARKKSEENKQMYWVLLLLTDGVITEGNGTTYLQDTIKEIVDASALPLSIVIVGVGNEDFEQMERIDGSKFALSHGGVRADRATVQFVPFRNYKNKPMQELSTYITYSLYNLSPIPVLYQHL